MNARQNPDLKERFKAVRLFCGEIWDLHSQGLPEFKPADARAQTMKSPQKVVWVYSKSANTNGEAHVGDMIILTSLVPLLRKYNIKLVCLSNPSLAPVFKDIADVIDVIPYTLSKAKVLERLADVTHVCPWADLLRRLQKAKPMVPLGPPPYIEADSKLATALRSDYAQSNRPLIGVVWRTSLIGRNPARDSNLTEWARIFTGCDADFISLQYGDMQVTVADLHQLKKETGINLPHDDRIDTIGDLPAYAAQIKACDAVVTIDCSTVFLSGAQGVRTLTLVPTDASFRWGESRGPCTYYPNNWLYRQESEGRWHGPLAAVSRDIATITPKAPAQPPSAHLESTSPLQTLAA